MIQPRSTPKPDAPVTDARLSEGLAWANRIQGRALHARPVAGDASFRRYFRLRDASSAGASLILMDAPPPHEDSTPFVDIAARLRRADIRAPGVLAADLERGYLLLEDLGDTLLRDVLDADSARQWMPHLFTLLSGLCKVESDGLPHYDRPRLQGELDLFTDWYLGRHRGIELAASDRSTWVELCDRLVESAQEQPAVFVHRDFHSANLLVQDDDSLGVIDFQDGVKGPITYDSVSLLWDRYIPWPRQRLEAWMDELREQLSPDTGRDDWVRWCDWMGLQRNLKIVGIFARLHHRDGKEGYLEMIPRFWSYVRNVLPRYPAFAAFDDLLERLSCAP